jgi:hypothetical protein
MATAAQIEEVRLYIHDIDSSNYDFIDSIINTFINKENSINYACLELLKILKTRLRKELLESDTSGTERTDLASLKDRLELLNDLIDEFQEKWDSENNNTTGVYIATTKPIIAGGDV